jgi:hypothetical protein
MGYVRNRRWLRPSITLLIVLLAAPVARAEETRHDSKVAPLVISPQAIQQALATAPQRFGVARQRASATHTGRRVGWTALGAVGGFFGGAFLGAAIENAVAPCGCDDPGFKGFLIGAPVGAIAGGIAGFVLSR